MKVEINEPVIQGISANQMRIGQVGIVCDERYRDYYGAVLLRHFSGFVDLSNPKRTWGNDVNMTLAVRILPKGTVLTLTTEV